MRGVQQNSKFLGSGFSVSAGVYTFIFLLPGRVNSKAAPYRTYDILRFTIIC